MEVRMSRRMIVVLFLTIVVVTGIVRAQNLGNVLGPLATIDVSTLIAPDDPALTDPATTEPATNDPPYLPRGGVYSLFGTARNGVDPQNSFNEVMKFDTTA